MRSRGSQRANRENWRPGRRLQERAARCVSEVRQALAQIRDKKLCRLSHDIFEGYCRNRWQYARSHVYRLIGAAEIFVHPSIGDNPGPANEAQVRPLIGLEPEKAKAAWEKAAE